MQGLDNWGTGRWGEDSVAPEFCKAEEIGDMEGDVRIDVSPRTEEGQIVATVYQVSITSGMVYLTAKEFEFPFVIPVGTDVYFADDGDY